MIEIYSDIPLFMESDHIDSTEYDQPTGKWFYHKNKGVFGYGITTGTRKTNEEYYIRLTHEKEEEISLARDIRFQLTERNHLLEKEIMIEEETIFLEKISDNEVIFSSHLPEKENVIYLLSVEVLAEDGQVEDTLVGLIYVPAQEMNVELLLDHDTYKVTEDELTIRLKNYGPTFLNLGTYYTIEKNIEGTWRVVPLDRTFEDIGIHVHPNKEYTQTIDIKELTEGEYRVIKDVHADGADLSDKLAVEFMIE